MCQALPNTLEILTKKITMPTLKNSCIAKANLPLYIFNTLFICILFLPFGLLVLGLQPNPIPIMENRTLTPKPDLNAHPLIKWPGLLDAYFKDQLAFRGHFLASYIQLWEERMQAPVQRYATGKNGELFMHHISPTFLPSLGVNPPSKEHRVNVKLSYAGMQGYFALRGIYYLLVTIPDKPTLYPEFLPFWATWKKTEQQNRYNQITAALQDTPINLLNLQEHLEQNKPHGRLYDTRYDVCHWNGNGLKVAHEQLVKNLAAYDKTFPQLNDKDYYRLTPQTHSYSGYTPEVVPFMEILQQNYLQRMDKHDGWSNPKVLINTREGTKHTLWLATDSYFLGTHSTPSAQFSGAITPLAHYVKKYVHMHYSIMDINRCDTLLDEHKPNFVIEAFVERSQGNAARASDVRIRVLGDALLNTPGHVLAPQQMADANIVNAEAYIEKEHIRLHAKNTDPMLILPPVFADADGRVVVMARLIAPADTAAQLFYTNQQNAFTEARSVKLALKKGENLVHMQSFSKPHEKVWLRFDPGAIAGDYYLLPMLDVQRLRGQHGL